MKFKLETKLDFFLLFIVCIKLVFVVSAIGHLCLSHVPNKEDNNTKTNKIDTNLVYWKKRTEFAFIISMSILLVYHFNPYVSETPIHPESKVLFFMFGLVLMLTANWSLFIKEAPWYKRIVNTLM